MQIYLKNCMLLHDELIIGLKKQLETSKKQVN